MRKKKHIWISFDFDQSNKMMNGCISEKYGVVDGLVSRWTTLRQEMRPGMRAMPVTMPRMGLG